ncbi:MAG: hypothetical protein IT186_00805 [Acidobacteria bacterium]|nr:hypothetical protein [Acidobacteriota bacterium]
MRFLAWTTLSQNFSCGRRAAPRARQIPVEIRPERMVRCSRPGPNPANSSTGSLLPRLLRSLLDLINDPPELRIATEGGEVDVLGSIGHVSCAPGPAESVATDF